jgi:hypothetical protein
MSTFERIDKGSKVVAILIASVVGITKILTAQYGDKPIHLAMYLLSSTWIEVVTLVCLLILYFTIKWIYLKWKTATSVEGSWFEDMLKPHFLAPALLSVVLVVILSIQLFYLARARRYFWTYLCITAYVENYKLQIDQLAAAGRITDAYNLNVLVMQMLPNRPEREYVERRRAALKARTTWSTKLVEGRTFRTWNPVTQRDSYYRLLEAIRINPQNYAAAEMMKQLIAPLENQYIKDDLNSLCGTNGNVDNFKGFATPRVEAKYRWSEIGGNGEAGCRRQLDDMSSAWNLRHAHCILRVSDATRLPFVKPDHPSKSSDETSRFTDCS